MNKKIKKSFLLKPVTILLVCSVLLLSFKTHNGTVILKAGTPVVLETSSFLSSDQVSPNQSVDFRVVHDVYAEGEIVIRAGAHAEGVVRKVEEAGMFRKDGYLSIQAKSVQTIDGQMVPLQTGKYIYCEGEHGGVSACGSLWFVAVVLLIGLILPGNDCSIKSGFKVTRYIHSNTKIYLNK